MISHRLSGLLNLHAVFVAVAAVAWLPVCAACAPYFLGVTLRPDVNQLAYVLAVAVAMVANARVLHLMSSRYHLCNWVDAARLTVRQLLLVALFIFGLMFVLKDRSFSRLIVVVYLAQLSLLLFFINGLLPRLLLRTMFQHQHRLPAVFIGSRRSLDRLKEWLAAKEALGIEPVGFFTDEGMPRQGTSEGTAIPFLGETASLMGTIRQRQVALVILLEIPRTSIETRYIVDTCQEMGCRLLVYNNLPDLLRHPVVPVTEQGHQFYTLQDEPLEDPLNRIAKRAFDLLVSVPVVLLVMPPLCLGVWLMHRRQSPGTLFYVQLRSGLQRSHFPMIKFRSMHMAPRTVENESVQAKKGDSRVYPLGLFLRKTSLDEFPQFINVLMGDMSIVGPRPHLPKHDDDFARFMQGYRTRFYVKPGITGLAQCRGFRGEITSPQLIRHRVTNDLEYITRWSIWLDLQITLKTGVQVMFPPKTAY